MQNKNEIAVQNGSLMPANFDQLLKYAEYIANSNLAPKAYQGEKEDVLIAIQLGAELGLKPLQALQNIAVINNRPCVWGDALIAICKNHPEFEDIKETFDESAKKATCVLKRKNQTAVTHTFSMEDAQRAGLSSKEGSWKTYPKRMLQMRARGFAMRDVFPDALKGFVTREEAEDELRIKDVTPVAEKKPIIIETPAIIAIECKVTDEEKKAIESEVDAANSREDLEKIWNKILDKKDYFGEFSETVKGMLSGRAEYLGISKKKNTEGK